ncbi:MULTISPECIES: tetratricopeptide repeat protein [Kitasatospora]|uniref:Tetratricopeptide repeat protein n=1 Tax=Kitasatospora cathayae TaxID=3004092 RepID=A0ABY7PVU7_9ACTN|nr:tetratricopeptide repeat protein [Kitasatospora sp. HUAS 3-15]WBP84554.1 tetratricopeptide repeat protein [Kitasatospora sp. HUAS 3-15]
MTARHLPMPGAVVGPYARRGLPGERKQAVGWWARRRLNRRLEAAEYLYKQLRWVDAERELRAVLEAAADGAGSLVGSARTLLAQALRMQGRLQEAESEARSAIAAQPVPGRFEERDGQDVLALVLGDMGRHQEAADLLAATAAARARITSSGQRLVLKSRSDRLQHLAYLGLHEEVVAEAAAVKTAASGTDDIHRIMLPLAAANGLAFSLSLHGHYEQAEQVLLPVLEEAHRQGLGRFLMVLHLGAARALTGQGRAQEALAAVDQAQETFDRTPGAGALTHDLSAILLARSAALLASSRPADAEHEARRCLSQCERRLGPGHHRALEAATVLGTALADLHRNDEAVELLHTTHDAWHTRFGHDHHGTIRARQLLAALTDQSF